MEEYRLGMNEFFDMVGGDIDIHLQGLGAATIREMKFVKEKGKHLMYSAHILNGSEIPQVNGYYEFIGTAPRKEVGDFVHSNLTRRISLVSLLNHKLPEGTLPEEIRVILPNVERDSWGVFFKYLEK